MLIISFHCLFRVTTLLNGLRYIAPDPILLITTSILLRFQSKSLFSSRTSTGSSLCDNTKFSNFCSLCSLCSFHSLSQHIFDFLFHSSTTDQQSFTTLPRPKPPIFNAALVFCALFVAGISYPSLPQLIYFIAFLSILALKSFFRRSFLQALNLYHYFTTESIAFLSTTFTQCLIC
jgi:hypothetical protein